jgi:hypothetical protein
MRHRGLGDFSFQFACESLDVSEKDAHVFVAVYVNFMKLTGCEAAFVILLARDVSDHFPGHEVGKHCEKSQHEVQTVTRCENHSICWRKWYHTL